MICVMKSGLKIAWKTKITQYDKKDVFFFKIPKNLIASDFFIFLFAEADTKTYRYASTKAWNATLVKLNYWIIKNDHVINCALFFCKW